MHANHSIEQEQADQVRRTTGATLAARALEQVLPAIANGYAPQTHRKVAERMSKNMDGPGFTPGPWLIGSNGDLDIGIVARDPGHGWQMVATVVIDEDVAQDEDEHLANARLIAAAPDLYAAVEDLLNQPTWNRTLAPYERDSLDRARAALSAARGEGRGG